MDRFTLRLPPDLARRFDTAAASEGGRSRFLRRLMQAAVQSPRPVSAPVAQGGGSGKLTLRLGAADLALLEDEAAAMGLARTQWAAALIRRRLHARAQFSRPDALAFIGVQRELRRIGVNINQIARALNTAVMDGAVLDLETTQLDAFADEIRGHLSGLRSAFEGDLSYWSDAP